MITFTVETFAFTCQADTLPPDLPWVESQVQDYLAQTKASPLQWAIVKSDPITQTLWIEGCCQQNKE